MSKPTDRILCTLWCAFNQAHATFMNQPLFVIFCPDVLLAYLYLCVCYVCSCWVKPLWSIWCIFPPSLILEEGDLFLILDLTAQSISPGRRVILFGMDQASSNLIKSGHCAPHAWIPYFSVAIFRPAGYKAVRSRVSANPSALCNCAVAMQFTFLSSLCSLWRLKSSFCSERLYVESSKVVWFSHWFLILCGNTVALFKPFRQFLGHVHCVGLCCYSMSFQT